MFIQKNKNIILSIVIIVMANISCTNENTVNEDSVKTNVIDSVTIDTLFKKICYEDNKTIKAEGFFNSGKKIGAWKEYDRKGNLIAAKHFVNDSLMFELDPSDFTFQDTIFKNSNIKMKYPINWEIISFDSSSLLIACKKRCNEKEGFCQNFVLTFEKSDSLIERSVENLLQLLKTSKKFTKFKLINIEELHNINKSFKITFVCRENGVKLGGVCFLFKNNNNLYNFSFFASNSSNGEFVKYKDVADEIISSIKLNND